MPTKQKLLLLYCEENLHVGAGSSTGTIDLPIQREGHTTFPKIEGSSLRGGIRESIWDCIDPLVQQQVDNFERIFGKKLSGDTHSCVDFPDAKILLFPVRSFKGVFAWITCPLVLRRLQKDIENWFNVSFPITITDVPNDKIIVNPGHLDFNNKVILEEYEFSVIPNSNIPSSPHGTGNFGTYVASILGNSHSIIDKITTNLAIVSDEVFRDFVNLYTVRITRNAIDSETGVAAGNALFNEELLPSESLLYSFSLSSYEYKSGGLTDVDVDNYLSTNLPKLFRLGGDKTIGKGLVRIGKN